MPAKEKGEPVHSFLVGGIRAKFGVRSPFVLHLLLASLSLGELRHVLNQDRGGLLKAVSPLFRFIGMHEAWWQLTRSSGARRFHRHCKTQHPSSASAQQPPPGAIEDGYGLACLRRQSTRLAGRAAEPKCGSCSAARLVSEILSFRRVFQGNATEMPIASQVPGRSAICFKRVYQLAGGVVRPKLE